VERVKEVFREKSNAQASDRERMEPTGWCPDDMRLMLQALNVHPELGEPSQEVTLQRKALESDLRGQLRQHKKAKRKPKGDFIKLLITHVGWNAARIRSILREPDVCRAHQCPTEAEMLWMCERNVPPVGSWLLSYTSMEDAELEEETRRTLDQWDEHEGKKAEEEQKWEKTCACFSAVTGTKQSDVWKGHVCTSDERRFRSPTLRALLRKGHAFKMEEGEETLLTELEAGLDGYVSYKTRKGGERSDYDAWHKAVTDRVRSETKRLVEVLYPKGDTWQREVKELQKALVFLKEDRAPHVVVAMCRTRYMQERNRYLTQGGTFREVTEESGDAIVKRHVAFHEERGLQPNRHLPYIYGIWKSAKRSLRWISGVRKGSPQLGKDGVQSEGKPEGSIAGVGKALVGGLQAVMETLRNKDDTGRRSGQPKRCWFVDSVEEVAQPLRFDAMTVARMADTADVVDFVTMYPSIDQALLLRRLGDALREAWAWKAEQAEHDGTGLRLTKDGWVQLTEDELKACGGVGMWELEEVEEMLEFVVQNGYVLRGGRIYHQVKGFGMGLACAPQLANLGCYPVERDFAAGCQPEEVEHNYRYIDDILTLSGRIPSEEEYGMKYKSTKGKKGPTVYLGMELWWDASKGTPTFVTGMHFRESSYPIRIRRYPAEGSMVTDSQRVGVLTGQFIRAQRVCSVMRTFKGAVQGVVLAAMRRGYKRREMDRMWGKFLVEWWKAEEWRRGELRAWFRKMCAWATRMVKKEIKGEDKQDHQSTKGAVEGNKERKMPVDRVGPQDRRWKPPRAPKRAGVRSAREFVPKEKGQTWRAVGDGSCLYHSVLGTNSWDEVTKLRERIAEFVGKAREEVIQGSGRTVEDMLRGVGMSVEEYQKVVKKSGEWGGEVELVLLARVLDVRLRVLTSEEEGWRELVEYGQRGNVIRLVYTPGSGVHAPHYDRLVVAWRLEEAARRWHGSKAYARMLSSMKGESEERRKKQRASRWMAAKEPWRRARLEGRRAEGEELGDEEMEDLLATMATDTWRVDAEGVENASAGSPEDVQPAERQEPAGACDGRTHEGVPGHSGAEEHSEEAARILVAREPWEALGVGENAEPKECEAAYRRLCLKLHPDKCKDPLGAVAMAKLAEAKQWGTDKEGYKAEQNKRKEDAWRTEQAGELMRGWLVSGAALLAVESEEALGRFFHEVDETLERTWGAEAFMTANLSLWWMEKTRLEDTSAGGRPRRKIEKTHVYDSEEVEQAERQKREACRRDKPTKKQEERRE
jgi:hypothetical protein